MEHEKDLYKKRFNLCLELLGFNGKEDILNRIGSHACCDLNWAIVCTAEDLFPEQIRVKTYRYRKEDETANTIEMYYAYHIIDGVFSVEHKIGHRVGEFCINIETSEDSLMNERDFLSLMNANNFINEEG